MGLFDQIGAAFGSDRSFADRAADAQSIIYGTLQRERKKPDETEEEKRRRLAFEMGLPAEVNINAQPFRQGGLMNYFGG